MMMAIAAHCDIPRVSRFARKNYFYPDLPKGYQISQYELPLARSGWVEIEIGDTTKRIGITRIHLEEDAGKSFHEPERTLVDFNRCGVPLMEVVSEPDLRSTDEAVAYLKTLRTILRYLQICDGNMEEGSLRCDANLSLRPKGLQSLGTRSELKNMNSFRGVQRALDFEIQRQRSLLERGEKVVQETRLWNEQEGATYSMRGKEESSDYRYFPEPDLLPVTVTDAWKEAVRGMLPELPDEKRQRFVSQYRLSPYDAGILISSRDLSDYFELCQREVEDAKLSANWIINELLGELKRDERELSQCPVTPEKMARMLRLLKAGTISGKMAKQFFEEMYKTGADPESLLEAQGAQITDDRELSLLVAQVIDENAEQVTQYRAGKDKLLGFFVGQVMKKSRGKANPQRVNDLLKEALKSSG
jgi:aspartyl-tRNA(Asn)/glutamyl-tRNA(Gln) amidotransferase subunit B